LTNVTWVSCLGYEAVYALYPRRTESLATPLWKPLYAQSWLEFQSWIWKPWWIKFLALL